MMLSSLRAVSLGGLPAMALAVSADDLKTAVHGGQMKPRVASQDASAAM